MKKKRSESFEFRTWGFEIYDILNIVLAVFMIIRLSLENGPVHLFVFRGIEIAASLALIVFIMLIWKNHEEVKERKYFSWAFFIAWVGVGVQAILAILIVPDELFNNPLFSEIFFEVVGLIALEAMPCAFASGSMTADRPKIWGPAMLVGVILIAVTSVLCVSIFFIYKDLSTLTLDDIIEFVSFSMPLFLSSFGLIELRRWKKAMPKVLPAEEK
ncbi:MAG: hypothetical protein K6F36_01385 [Bacilli bacterium]|nr:hypothetical protein [Bacilli bacterium]